MEIFKPVPEDVRKIIVSTNIAESSVTIPGVVFVIDTMMQKTKFYDYDRNYELLVITPISKQSATQRAGRAGRIQNGECYRLCTEEDYEAKLFEHSLPEILRSNIADFIVKIKSLGVRDITSFELLT